MTTTSRGYVDEIVQYFISDYVVRLAGFLGTNPIYDSIAVPASQISTVWQQPGIRCIYPLQRLVIDAMLFNYNTSSSSAYIGDGQWGESGIIPTFFSDVHVRRAIAYSLNWSQVIASAYLGEAQQVPIPLPTTLPFYNSSLPKYSINVTRAVEEWKLAWGGNSTSPGLAWTQGFYFTIEYYGSRVEKQAWAQNLKASVEALNPKFHIILSGLPWGGKPPDPATLPLSIRGWLADYADVGDWVTPFIQSSGTFAIDQHINLDPYSPLMDNLVVNGAHNNTFEGRNANYRQLWQLYIQQIPSIPLVQPSGRRWARDWVHGWYYNPIFPGVHGYPLWKENIKASSGAFAGKSADWEDINEDGKVDIKDLATAAKAFGAYFIQPLLPPGIPPPIPPPPAPWYSPNWNSKADVNVVDPVTGGRCDMKVDIKDLATMAKLYGFVAPAWQPGP
jgi:ABC-type transport system substrate-binding protein